MLQQCVTSVCVTAVCVTAVCNSSVCNSSVGLLHKACRVYTQLYLIDHKLDLWWRWFFLICWVMESIIIIYIINLCSSIHTIKLFTIKCDFCRHYLWYYSIILFHPFIVKHDVFYFSIKRFNTINYIPLSLFHPSFILFNVLSVTNYYNTISFHWIYLSLNIISDYFAP